MTIDTSSMILIIIDLGLSIIEPFYDRNTCKGKPIVMSLLNSVRMSSLWHTENIKDIRLPSKFAQNQSNHLLVLKKHLEVTIMEIQRLCDLVVLQ